jgi:hypothetical protein
VAIQQFPIPVTAISKSASSLTIPTGLTLYVAMLALPTGIYKISHLDNTTPTCNVEFMNGQTVIGSTATVSGTISFNLSTACTSIRVYTTSGTNLLVSIEKTADAVTIAASGTIDTLTTSQTYNQTGELYVVIVGGGGGGGRNNSNPSNTGVGGGGSGGVQNVREVFNTSSVVTIGNGGNGAATGTVPASGNAGGATSFGNYTSNGGAGGAGGGRFDTLGGAGGTPGGGQGGSRDGTPGQNGVASTASSYPYLVSGTTGGGGGVAYNGTANGAGSGIGTGGNGTWGNIGNSGTGYGSGGGGSPGGANSQVGNGRPGVVYVLRGVTY